MYSAYQSGPVRIVPRRFAISRSVAAATRRANHRAYFRTHRVNPSGQKYPSFRKPENVL